MAQATQCTMFGNVAGYVQGTGTNANDVNIQTGDVSAYDNYTLMSDAGAVQVLVTLDGTNYSTAPLSLEDLGATTSTPVLLTAALRVYRFRGNFYKIRVTQSGATASSATLFCAKTHVAG